MNYRALLGPSLCLGLIALPLQFPLSALAQETMPLAPTLETAPPTPEASPPAPAGETVDPDTAAERIVTALTTPPGAPPRELAQTLLDKMKGLTQDNRVNRGRLLETIKAYNAVVEASNDEYLGNPPKEFLSIFNFLSQLSEGLKENK
ncbi:MAG: hypothetical protein KME35_14600 [Aphanocapsa sp. GSE-SYN-MK-11-07L]|jgi:hypothetical protein|nr:hypothetical protein [Aphanocapsa sp. GSE-SYN-MK-11-07L]